MERRPEPLTIEQFRPTDPKLAALGRLLFYDPILSGNRNIACATCHHHDHDGLSLPVGEGGRGIGPRRDVGEGASRVSERVPRHSPTLFNLGHVSIRTLFHDGRLSVDPSVPSGFDSPVLDARLDDLPPGLDGIVAAQAMLPVTSRTEMAGHPTENEIARDGLLRPTKVWGRLARRVAAIPDYVALFVDAYSEVEAADDIRYRHVANALADFIESEWRSMDAPYDRWLRGEPGALSPLQERGASIFYGRGACAACHAGPLLTDQRHHALAMPQIGPGRTRVFADGAFDRGRVNVTDRIGDAYRFRTPSLRNVASTAPYTHAGAYSRLESVIRHHIDPEEALASYDPSEAILPRHDTLTAADFLTHGNDRERGRMLAALDPLPRGLNESDIEALVAFLHALDDPVALMGRLGAPKTVPSGLPVE